jgi:hypothetical protein
MRTYLSLVLTLALLLAGCTGAPTTNETLLKEDAAFLKRYGWTIADRVAVHRLDLPDRFADEPGAYPVGLYWAYNNQLSKAIGLDLAPYAGKTVDATMYRVNEPLGDDNPNQEMRAVLIKRDGQLVGAYLDRMGHYGFAASLDKRTLPQITGKPFGQWLTDAGIVDWSHPFYREIANLEPADLIPRYYQLIDQQRYDEAYRLHSLPNRMGYLFPNRERTALYNGGFEDQWGGIKNMRAAIFKGFGHTADRTGEWHPGELNRQVTGARQFLTSLDLTLRQELTSRSGPHTLFITAVKETPQAPWLLDGWGTGP